MGRGACGGQIAVGRTFYVFSENFMKPARRRIKLVRSRAGNVNGGRYRALPSCAAVVSLVRYPDTTTSVRWQFGLIASEMR